MRLLLRYSTRCRRDIKRVSKRGKDIKKMEQVIDMLQAGEVLPARYRDHPLKGEWQGYMECHIEPDWLMVYQRHENLLIVMATGTHADLFE
jgi:mRNA interferase YafQ